ncbi:hypothetical protein HGA15_30895 [Nocardia flavorosea]|uniref:Uncharacterized protein n=3 Tax=Nocardia flavorosea TaxID=53429 RepID=A0A846YSE3_9NOCA|nr:hypothetical protein [Nocardia flavorosea]
MMMNDVSAQESSVRTDEHSASVIAIVNLMLDWDLLDLELSLDELAEWLEVYPAEARRALQELGTLPGVDVLAPEEPHALVRAAVDIDRCPLTAERPGTLRLVYSRAEGVERGAFADARPCGEAVAAGLRRRA